MSPRQKNRRREHHKPASGNRAWRRANPLFARLLAVEAMNDRRNWIPVPVPPLGPVRTYGGASNA